MGVALIQLKIMPSGLEVNLEDLKKIVTEKISTLDGEVTKIEEKDVAFGLKALIVFIRIDEDKDTSLIEDAMKDVEVVSSSDVVDYRRAIE